MYFKITNQEECHHGYQYQTGLNILNKPFEPEGSCVEGGLYFTTLEYLDQFYDFGVWLREVRIPENAKMVKDPEGCKWRADKIILGERYSLYDVETIKKFNLKINEYYIDQASEKGCLKILEWSLKTLNKSMPYSCSAINNASTEGHVKVLDWWVNSGLEFKYTKYAIDWASQGGHVDVLEWWLKAKNDYGLELKYSDMAIYCASLNCHSKVLDWWLKASNESGLDLKYSSASLDCASRDGSIKILDWWKSSGLELKYSFDVMEYAYVNGPDSVVEWWKSYGLELK